MQSPVFFVFIPPLNVKKLNFVQEKQTRIELKFK
jgi:hypothetical protein